MLRPREIVVPSDVDVSALLPEGTRHGASMTTADAWSFDHESARRTLLDQLRAGGLEGFGLEDHRAAVCAAGALLQYLRDTQKVDLAHVRSVAFRSSADCLLIDPITLKHLEVVESVSGSPEGSLLHAIDRTVTPMGGRLLRSWLLRPLVALERIADRLDAVEDFAFRTTERGKFRDVMKTVHDMERLVSRAALGRAGPRDLVALQQSATAVPRIRAILQDCEAPLAKALLGALDDLADVRESIEEALVDDPPDASATGASFVTAWTPSWTISGGSADRGQTGDCRARRARAGAHRHRLAESAVQPRVRGHYIEVSRSNLHAVPADYQRKQTIAGGERYITPALKEHEEKVLGADARILEREAELFEALRGRVAIEAPRIQHTARALATLDALAALAETATICNYIKPHVHDGDEFRVTDGRHPVVERHASVAFVPNDITLDGSASQLVILTGPNMGGKSTYLRQTAVICLMAQAGSFVPAGRAKVSLVDRIYARVGASDNITRGQSTFMVEMQETANILHGASSSKPRRPGRDRTRHGDVRRAGHRSRRRRVPRHNERARPQDALRHPLPRADRPGRCSAGRRQLPLAARESQDGIVFFAQDCRGQVRPQLWDSGRAAGGDASVGDRPCPRYPRGPGARRDARGGRPSISGTPAEPQRQLGLFQAVPSAPTTASPAACGSSIRTI